ncbi:glycerophosphodiester phosphodiesterase domain-containing protein 1 [Limosa lapponica baueri]|uniref:Glycerophosphodiester phosphodiesterase domain-containing protein 1 n=1 Tax=Limosa lapponica baueri TaxID=1758121 RepID=A0A2I0TBB2_LIMLA|nr:glycerophosphodiester phosphodiesterase domain-containing protein 1 [Limosa lapponica baueri]
MPARAAPAGLDKQTRLTIGVGESKRDCLSAAVCLSRFLQNADIPIIFCLQRVLLLLGLFYTGLLPFIPFKEEFLEIPMPSIILKLKEPQKITRSQKFVIWLADTLLMRKALFDHLTARGIQVYIWVLNEEQEYKRAFDLGATGVMTDYPTKLKEFLHNYPA